jgi:hypothetical protein
VKARRELVHRGDPGAARDDYRARARRRIGERRAERTDHADLGARLEIGEQRGAAAVHLEQDLDRGIATAGMGAVHRHRPRQQRIGARRRCDCSRREHDELARLAARPARQREHEPPVHAALVGERHDAASAADRSMAAGSPREAHPFSTSIP